MDFRTQDLHQNRNSKVTFAATSEMAENFRVQRVRSFYPLAGTGPFISNSSDTVSVRPNSRRPYTGGFQVSSAKTHDRADMYISKRVSTAVDSSRRRPNREPPRATTLENSQMDGTGGQPIVTDPSYRSPYKTSATSVAVGDSAGRSENPAAVVESEIIRPKRTITVILPSLRMSDDEDDIVATDTACGSHASFNDAERDSPMHNRSTNTKQHLANDNSKGEHQRSVATSSSNDHTRLDQSDRKKSAVPVYKIKYVHFDKNRAAVGHARQIANRLYAINVQRQSSAFDRIELA